MHTHLPAFIEAHRIVIYEGGDAVGDATFAADPPEVSFLKIDEREHSRLQKVRWEAASKTDIELALKFTLRYSVDGEEWRVILADTTEKEWVVDLSQLPGGDGRFQVLASAGLRTGVAESPRISVPPTPREFHVLSPKVDAVFNAGESVPCIASAFSPTFRNPGTQEIIWSSPRFGYMGSGTHLVMQDLPVGKHWIELRAPDGMGNLMTRAIPITIQSPPIGGSPLASFRPRLPRRCKCH